MPKFTIFFILILLAGIFKTLFTSPVWGFYLYEVLYFFNPQSRWWSSSLPNISFSFWAVLLTMAMFFLNRKNVTSNSFRELTASHWFIILLLLYMAVSFVAIIPVIHNKFLTDFIKLFLISFIAFKLLDNQEKIERALYAFIFGAAYIGYEAYVVGRDQFGRVEGIGLIDLPDSNGTAATIVATIPLMLYFFWQKKWLVKILIGVAGILVVNGLVLINSRGGFLGALMGFTYLITAIMFSKYRYPKQRLMVIFILIGSLFVVNVVTDDLFWERMQTIEDTSADDTNASGARRINFWMATFDMLDDHPLGLGIYGFQMLSPLYLSDELLGTAYRSTNRRAVHSMWFQVMGEVGYVGLVIYIFIFLSVFLRTRKAKKHCIALKKYDQFYLILSIEAGYLGFLVSGSFINAFRAEVHFWLLIFLISISAVVLRQKLNDNNEQQLQKK